MLRIYNTLTRKIEEFKSLTPGKVGMYTCGPTVYDLAHIGNFRTYIFEDILQRTLQTNGFEMMKVMNITDIEDKIIKNAKEKGLDIAEFTAPFEKAFKEDLDKLNILPANVYPKATEHIEKMVKYIEELIKKGLAYEKDGSVYFDISEFPEYGKLSGLEGRTLKAGTRVLSDEYSKDEAQDFALWKAVDPDEVGYDSPWGRGRPGWHIECSVMSQEYLGDSFDIHCGAVDLIFPHHENEIAQSEGKTGKKFVNFFMEGEHLLVDGQKMSKSLKNIFSLKDLEDKGFEPLAFRYLCLTAHYRDKLNFTWGSLQAAQNALNNLRDSVRDLKPDKENKELQDKFLDALNNDLNTPQALAVLWEAVKSGDGGTILEMDKVLGLEIDKYLGKKLQVSSEVMELVEKRESVRKSGNFEESDKLRKEINDLGYELEDTPKGTKIK